MNIDTIGVLGAGVIGVGVAQNLAQVGYNVILLDVSDRILEQAKNENKGSPPQAAGYFRKVSTDNLREVSGILYLDL